MAGGMRPLLLLLCAHLASALTECKVSKRAIKIDFENHYARTVIQTHVRNPSSYSNCEIAVTNALPDGAYLARLEMQIGTKVYYGLTEQKSRAKAKYDTARAQKKNAMLLKQGTDGKFTINITLSKGDSGTGFVTIRMEELIERELGTYEYGLDLCPEGRYDKIPTTVEVDVQLKGTDEFSDMEVLSPTEAVSGFNKAYARESDQRYKWQTPTIHPYPHYRRGYVFRFRYRLREKSIPVTCTPGVDCNVGSFAMSEEGYFRHAYVPPYDACKVNPDEWNVANCKSVCFGGENEVKACEIKCDNSDYESLTTYCDKNQDCDSDKLCVKIGNVLPKRVVLVIDKSGSMWGSKWRNSIASAKYMIDRLKETDKFGIVLFGSGTYKWRTYMEFATSTNKYQAKRYLDQNRAGGGTNLNMGLEQGLAMLDAAGAKWTDEYANMIWFLSDGWASSGQTNRSWIRTNIKTRSMKSQAMIFSIAYGTNADFELVRGIARESRGYELLVPIDNSALGRLKHLWEAIETPLVKEFNIEYEPQCCKSKCFDANSQPYCNAKDGWVEECMSWKGMTTEDKCTKNDLCTWIPGNDTSVCKTYAEDKTCTTNLQGWDNQKESCEKRKGDGYTFEIRDNTSTCTKNVEGWVDSKSWPDDKTSCEAVGGNFTPGCMQTKPAPSGRQIHEGEPGVYCMWVDDAGPGGCPLPEEVVPEGAPGNRGYIFHGTEVVYAGRMPSGTDSVKITVTLKTKDSIAGGREVKYVDEYPAKDLIVESYQLQVPVERTWSMLALKEWSKTLAREDPYNTSTDRRIARMRTRAEEIAMKQGFVTQWTSMVIVINESCHAKNPANPADRDLCKTKVNETDCGYNAKCMWTDNTAGYDRAARKELCHNALTVQDDGTRAPGKRPMFSGECMTMRGYVSAFKDPLKPSGCIVSNDGEVNYNRDETDKVCTSNSADGKCTDGKTYEVYCMTMLDREEACFDGNTKIEKATTEELCDGEQPTPDMCSASSGSRLGNEECKNRISGKGKAPPSERCEKGGTEDECTFKTGYKPQWRGGGAAADSQTKRARWCDTCGVCDVDSLVSPCGHQPGKGICCWDPATFKYDWRPDEDSCTKDAIEGPKASASTAAEVEDGFVASKATGGDSEDAQPKKPNMVCRPDGDGQYGECKEIMSETVCAQQTEGLKCKWVADGESGVTEVASGDTLALSIALAIGWTCFAALLFGILYCRFCGSPFDRKGQMELKEPDGGLEQDQERRGGTADL